MSLRYEIQDVQVKTARQSVVVEATCDCCGEDCWYPAHRRPTAVLSRVQDDDMGNMDIWDLDLCEECKNSVLWNLRVRARRHDRILPDHRAEIHEPSWKADSTQETTT